MSNFVSSLKKKIKQAEAKDLGWSFERPKELVITEHDTVGSILQLFSLHFQWWRTRWPQLDENHQNVVINLFGAHPVILSHIWKILDKNFDEKDNYRYGQFRVSDMEYVLMEKLGLLSPDVEIEIYKEKQVEEIKDTENV